MGVGRWKRFLTHSPIPSRRVLPVVELELSVEFGVLAEEEDGAFEEKFGGDREELGGVGGAVGIEEGFAVVLDRFDEFVVGALHDGGPLTVGGLAFGEGLSRKESGGAIDGAVLLVELMGEFVEGDVVPVAGVAIATLDRTPGEDDGAGGPGSAEHGRFVLADDTRPTRVEILRNIGFRIHQDGRE